MAVEVEVVVEDMAVGADQAGGMAAVSRAVVDTVVEGMVDADIVDMFVGTADVDYMDSHHCNLEMGIVGDGDGGDADTDNCCSSNADSCYNLDMGTGCNGLFLYCIV